MGKSENGPGMLDWIVYANEIRGGQECEVSLLVEPRGSVVGSTVSIGILAKSIATGVDGPCWTASVLLTWPDVEGRTFTAAIYNALYRLDAEIGRSKFVQATLENA